MELWKRITMIGLFTLALQVGLARAQQALPPEVVAYPDTIFHNGKVLTADDSFATAQAVAIRDGKFLAVGDSSRILAMAGPQTRKIDLQGKMVLPGLIDTHMHIHNYSFMSIVNGGIDIFPGLYLHDLEGNETKEGVLRALRKKGQQTTRQEGWLIFSDPRGEDHGLLEQKLFPQLAQQDLNEALPGGPAAVGSSHANNYTSYTLNDDGLKIALEKLPPGIEGIIKDTKTGKPSGQLIGEAAQYFGRVILPWPDLKLVIQALEKSIPIYTSQGITMTTTKTPGYVIAAFRELWRRGQMPMRWRAQIELGPDTLAGIKYLGNLTDLGDPWLRIAAGPGGLPETYFDATYEQPRVLTARGLRDSQSPEARAAELKRGTDAYFAAKYGWSFANVHNNGDLSTDVFLGEVEKGLQERVIEAYAQRVPIDHGKFLKPVTPAGNQFEKMKKMGIVHVSMNMANMMEPHPVGDDPTKPAPRTEVEENVTLWGREATARMIPNKSLIKAGFKPTLESDRWYFPASYPFWIMEKAITRKDDKLGEVWGPEERVTRQEALWMKTNWAAYHTGDEKDLGTIEPGKLADLVVIDKDYLTVPEDEISDIRVLMTVIGGKVFYDAARNQVPLPRPPGVKIPAWAEAVPARWGR